MPDGFDWSDKRVIVTGGAGFVGREVCRLLRERGVADDHLFVPRRRDYDLTDAAQVGRMYREAFRHAKSVVVLHLAAEVGGIGANRRSPGRFFFANMAMALNLIEGARLDGLPERGGTSSRSAPSAPIPSSPPFPSAKKNSGTATPKRPTPPTASPRRPRERCWRRTGGSTGCAARTCCP